MPLAGRALIDVPLRLRARGTASPDVAWERYADVDRWSDWSPYITGVDAVPRRLAPGLAGRVRGPAGVSVGFVVLDVDPAARQWSWRVTAGPVEVELRHAVGPDGPGSVTTLDLRGPAPVVVTYAPLALLSLTRLVRP